MSTIFSFMRTVKKRKHDSVRDQKTAAAKKKCAVLSVSKDTSVLLNLPGEVMFQLFDFIDFENLGKLSLTSKSVRNNVVSYLYWERTSPRIAPRLKEAKTTPDTNSTEVNAGSDACSIHYMDLGLLMKRVTCLFSTKERLKHVGRILDKLHVAHAIICSSLGSSLAYSCYGEFLHAFIAGWEDDEKARAFAAIKGASLLQERTEKVVKTKPGSYPDYERYIRVFCREIFLDKAERSDVSFWMSLILKPWALCFQAKLLFIIYGPANPQTDEVVWDAMVYNPGMRPSELTEIGSVLKLMQNDRKQRWSSDDIVSLFAEVTSTPSEWDMENVASLMRSCGDSLCCDALGNKAINGRHHELAYILYYIWQGGSTDCKDGIKVSTDWFTSLLRHVSAHIKFSQDRDALLKSILNIWEDTTIEMIAEHQYFPDSQVDDDDVKLKDHLRTIKSLAFTLMQHNAKPV